MGKKSLFERIEDLIIPLVEHNPLLRMRSPKRGNNPIVPENFGKMHRKLAKGNIFLRLLVIIAGILSIALFFFFLALLLLMAFKEVGL